MKNKLHIFETAVFCAILVFWLVPVWKLDFFVTGDGPCHLFNSKILLDWAQGVNKDFYKPFYFLNTNFDPNWLFNLITMVQKTAVSKMCNLFFISGNCFQCCLLQGLQISRVSSSSTAPATIPNR